jgi:hypothetical protein
LLLLHSLRSATPSVDGSATIRCVLLFAIRFVSDLVARCSARRLHAPSAPFIARNPSVAFDARKICARRTHALSARLFALPLNATPSASRRIQYVPRSVRRLRANGSAGNQACVRNQSASCNVRNLRAKLNRTVRVSATTKLMFDPQCVSPADLLLSKLSCTPPFWRSWRPCFTSTSKAETPAARVRIRKIISQTTPNSMPKPFQVFHAFTLNRL